MTENAIVNLIGLNKWYGDFHVLRDINLDVAKSERIVICGPSGSGKSTLIRCIRSDRQPYRPQQMVRRFSRAARHQPRCCEKRAHRDLRSVRLGQIHADPLHQIGSSTLSASTNGTAIFTCCATSTSMLRKASAS